MFSFHCQLNCRYHITVGRHNNGEVAIILIRVSYNLCCNTHIGFLFFVCMYLVNTLETSYFFLKIFKTY